MRGFFIAAATAVAVFCGAPSGAMAFGDTCYGALSVKGQWEHNRHDAMWSAIDKWEHKAGDKHGGNHDNWHYSGDRSVDCKWDDNGSHFVCTAKALPCGRPHSH